MKKRIPFEITKIFFFILNIVFFSSSCALEQQPKIFFVISLLQEAGNQSATSQFSVGGTVSGLTGTGLVLQNNGGDDTIIQGNGSFTFGMQLIANVAYAVTVKTNPSSPVESCTVTNGSGTITSANITNVTIACASLSIVYTGSPYIYTVNTAITSNTPTIFGTITTCSANPALPAGLTINNTTCAISGTPTSIQTSTAYTITASDSVSTVTATINITVDASPPSALTYTASPYTFTQNTAITTQTPTFSGSLTSCNANPALPAGLTINNTTCAISGTPTGTQVATTHTITASNSIGNTTASIMITVNSNNPPSSLIYTGSPYTYMQNVAITTQTPTVTGTVTSCSSSPTLPTGLSINATTCAISGTPTVTQSATTYTITASNVLGSTTTTIVITVNLFYSTNTFAFKTNSAINSISPTGSGAISGCSVAPALPIGLSLSSACVISGTPTSATAAANYTITPTMTGGPANAIVNIAVLNTLYRIFVTASVFNGDLKTAGGGGDGAAGADNLCNADTNKPTTGAYKAFIVDGANREICSSANCGGVSNVNWIMQPSAVYVRASDSAMLFTSNGNRIYTSFPMTNSFDSGVQKKYWTGMRGSGNEWMTSNLHYCNLWKSNSSSSFDGRFGLSDKTDYTAIGSNTYDACNSNYYLLCVEQ